MICLFRYVMSCVVSRRPTRAARDGHCSLQSVRAQCAHTPRSADRGRSVCRAPCTTHDRTTPYTPRHIRHTAMQPTERLTHATTHTSACPHAARTGGRRAAWRRGRGAARASAARPSPPARAPGHRHPAGGGDQGRPRREHCAHAAPTAWGRPSAGTRAAPSRATKSSSLIAEVNASQTVSAAAAVLACSAARRPARSSAAERGAHAGLAHKVRQRDVVDFVAHARAAWPPSEARAG